MNPKNKAEREELLHQLWAAQMRVLIERMNNTPASELSAAMLREVRAFLADQGVQHESMNRSVWASAPGLTGPLPTVPDDDLEGDADARGGSAP